jgi:hypothetical protein
MTAMPSYGRRSVAALAALLLSGCGAAADLVAPTPSTSATTGVSCGPVEESEPEPADHVEDGTDIEYESAPPASGPHWGVAPVLVRPFYTSQDRPPVEQLVHSLEHGWTIVWYDDTVAADQAQLASLQNLARQLAESGPEKVVVVPWESEDGPLDSGHLAMTHWGAEVAYRQFCDGVDPAAVLRFAEEHPYTDSPEPTGQ